jgi:hypothetical protein
MVKVFFLSSKLGTLETEGRPPTKKTVLLSMTVFLATGVVFFPIPMQRPFVV